MPLNPNKYPKNWKSIALTIKNAAKWRCEECHRPCRQPGVLWSDFVSCLKLNEEEWCQDTSDGGKEKTKRFMLTVAHLNQNTRDNRRENPKALCTKCHLKHDAKHHIRNAKLTKRRKKLELYQSIGQQLLLLER